MTIANYTCVFTNKSLQSVGIKSAIRSRIPAGAITFFKIKSVLTTYSSKGGISYLHEDKEKEHATERKRERE